MDLIEQAILGTAEKAALYQKAAAPLANFTHSLEKFFGENDAVNVLGSFAGPMGEECGRKARLNAHWATQQAEMFLPHE